MIILSIMFDKYSIRDTTAFDLKKKKKIYIKLKDLYSLLWKYT